MTKEFRENLYGEIIETYKEDRAKGMDRSTPIKDDGFMKVDDRTEGLPIR